MALNNEFKVKNDLNTLGRILSGGTDLTTIFSPSNTSWTLSATNGNFPVAGGDTLGIQGGNGVDVRANVSTETVTISGIDATTTTKGVASFSSDNFAVTSGAVTIKNGGVANDELAGSITDDKLNTISTAGKVANSATTATSSNTANAIVARGASGEFSSGSITATGNLSASGSVTGSSVVADSIVASNITATNLLSSANTFTRVLSVGNVQVRTVGTSNVFIGDSTTGRDAATGNYNFVFGCFAGNALTTGSNNNFFGRGTGRNNTNGNSNNFLGSYAGRNNTSGAYNNFLGNGAGYFNTTGAYNNFFGYRVGFSNDTGTNNNFFGRYAGCTNTIGSNNTIIGKGADVATNALSGVIVLGTGAVATQTNQIVLSTGDISVRSLRGTAAGPNVFIGDSTTGRDAATGSHNFVFGLSAGNALTSGCNNVFIGNCAGRVNNSGCNNNFLGSCAGFCNTTGGANNFFGFRAGCSNTTGNCNNFLGYLAGSCNTTGSSNNFIGRFAGYSNTTGSNNNFLGSRAGRSNTTGSNNNFFGCCAGTFGLFNCAVGSRNSSFGDSAGCGSSAFTTVSASNNSFFGFGAGRAITDGCNNNIFGYNAGCSNTTGNCNNFIGDFVGRNNTTGNLNNFFGNQAGCCNTTGNANLFLGNCAGGYNRVGSNNIFIGNKANTASVNVSALSGVIVLGTGAVATESHQIVLSTANVVFKNTGSTFEIGTPSLTDNLTVYGAVSSTGIVNTNTGFRISNAATSGHVLRGNGTNFVSSTLAASDIASGQALTKADDTNVTLALGGTPSTALLKSTSLTLGWTGQLAVDRGGTGTATGSITGVPGALTFAAGGSNQDINLTPSGTGEVNIPKVDIDSGTIDGTTIGADTASTGKFTQVDVDNIRIDGNTISSTNFSGSINITPQGFGVVNLSNVNISTGNASLASLDVDNIRIDSNTISSTNSNGNITLAPNGTGDVQLDADTVRIGDSGAAATLTTNGAGNLTLNTNGGTNSGTITINQGINGNIDLTPNGTGEVNISKVDIDGGAIDNTPIGFTTPSTGKFTALEVTNDLTIEGNLFVQGTATYINTQDLVIQDPIIYIAEGNPDDALDIGLVAAWTVPASGVAPTGYQHGGLVRRVDTKKWTLFRGLTSEPLSGQNLSWEDPTLTIETLVANFEGTLTGNVSGTAAQAVKLTTGRTISATGDISYVSGAFDGSANVVGTATINNNAVTTAKILDDNVTYAKIQEASANTILGNPTGSTANITEISCTTAGRALLSAANASAQRDTLGVGSTQSVTFGDVIVNNGTKSVLNDVYNDSVASGNTLTLQTFANASYNSAKYVVQIKNTSTSRRSSLEILATKDNTTWEGTVYAIIDPGSLFTNVDIGVTGSTVDLAFTFNGNANYTVIAYAQAISD